MKLTFLKYQGAGNDFILIDNRNAQLHLSEAIVSYLCDRHFGIGADGLMLLETSHEADFFMRYYNSDGRESTMCGNGGRCITAFASHLGIARETYHFRAIDGPHQASLLQKNGHEMQVSLQMKDVTEVLLHGTDYFLNTGSPHVVRFVENPNEMNVVSEGRSVRYSEKYASQGGTNVNFAQTTANGLYVRTYERGVENETLACGTGAVASAIAATVSQMPRNDKLYDWEIQTPGGLLHVSFCRNGNNFTNVLLTGPASLVFTGVIEIEC